MKYVVRVIVSLRDGVLDPQGETINRALHDLGFTGVIKTNTGKIFRLEIEADTEGDCRKIADSAASKLLANPIIERYDIEVAR